MLSPDKQRVFNETFRVLKPSGRLIVSDIVLTRKLPDFIRNSVEAYVGCVSGAIMKAEYIEAVRGAGFQDVKVVEERSFPIESLANDPNIKAIINTSNRAEENFKKIDNSVLSIKVEGKKLSP